LTRENDLLRALPPPAAEAMRNVLADPELDRWMRMPTQQALRGAMVAVGYEKGQFPPVESLTPAQRAFLEICAGRPELDVAAPEPRWSIRRWLGLDPMGALERVVTHDVAGKTETSPLWREFDVARGQPPEIRRRLERLSMGERLAVYGELDAGAYGFTEMDMPAEFPGIDGLRDEGRQWAPRHADWLLERAKDPLPYQIKRRLRIRPPLFLSFARSRMAIERRWEIFLPLPIERPDILRECFEAVPEARRVPAVRAALPAGYPEATMKILIPLMDMFPLPGLMDLAFERHLGFYPPKKETLAELADLAKRRPVLADALAANRKKKPLKLVVETRPRPAEPALTPLQKQQVARLDENTYNQLEFFVVSDAKGPPRYDVILHADSDGSVFKTGTSEVVATIAQRGADGDDGALCMALDEAFAGYRKKSKAKKPAKKRA
jgi:hypothetical protein